jgi:hypothetical protein
MSRIYLTDDLFRTSALKRVRCADEDKELHQLLLANPDLLPGDQIDPEAPRRWLLVKHEMPVTDPATGALRWSIDLFFVDQMGIPTLVECKRCDDTRSRREVVAQMLEYAANGHHYWTASEMRSFAETSAGGAESLHTKLVAIRGDDDQSVDDFFVAVERNLREAKMRLVFFLEESPNELRSLVDFLNKQLKDTEVLLVEARQYQHGPNRIIVPWLFGFTEEARVTKRESRAETIRAAGERGPAAFWSAVEAGPLSAAVREKMRFLVDAWDSGALQPYGWASWGASAIFVVSQLEKRGLFAVTRNGALEMYFGSWDESKYSDIGPRQMALRDKFRALVENTFGVQFLEKQRFPKISSDQWVPRADEFVSGLRELLAAEASTTGPVQ